MIVDTLLILVVLLLPLAGVALVYRGIRGLYKANVVKHWPTVSATLTRCEWKSYDTADGKDYEVKVEYMYCAEGKEHVSSQVGFNYDRSNDYKEHDDIYRKLRKTLMVAARYNPRNPQEAVLSCKASHTIFEIVFGLFFFLFTLSFYCFIFTSDWLKPEVVDKIEVISARPRQPAMMPR